MTTNQTIDRPRERTVANPDTGEIVREGFGDRTIEHARETASASMVAQAQAQIQASYIMARQHPRSWDDVRERLLKDCRRPGFAKSAIYRKPQRMKDEATGRWVNGHLEGLSIRFAEDCMRHMGNLRAGSIPIYDDQDKRIVQVYAVDLETNAIPESSVVVQKTVERSEDTVRDRTILATRENSAGKKVYLVEATAEEIRQKQGADVSRERRNLILSLVPADIREEAFELAKATIKAAIKADPDGERKLLTGSFAALNVMPANLEAYLGHELATASPAELETLRGLYTAIKEGAASWQDLIAEKEKPPEERPLTSKGKELAANVRARRQRGATTTQTSAPGAVEHRGEPTDGEPPEDVETTGER